MSLWRRIYTERRAVLLPLIVLVAANVGVLVLAVLPLAQHVSNLETAAQNAASGLIRSRVVEKQAKDAKASKERADQELKKFYVDILPTNASASRKLFSFLEQTAQQSGLLFQRSSFDEGDVKDSQLSRRSGKVTLIGDYQNIRKFLYTVETAQEFVVIERVGLAQATDLRSTNSGRLEITLDVATYFVMTPSAQ